MIVYSFV